MSIDNMPDEELDKLFRQSAHSFDPPYDPEAWSAMEKKLDQATGGPGWWHSFIYPTVLLLLIGSGLTVHKLTQAPDAIPVAAQKAEESAQEPAREQSRHITKVQRQQAMEDDAALALQEPESSGIAAGRVKVRAEENTIRQDAPPAVWTFHQDSTLKSHETQPATRGIPDSPPLPLSAADIKRPGTAPDSLYLETSKSSSFLSSLQVQLVTAPEVTTVKFDDPETRSLNAGVLVDIPLTKRFSLVTGALWANKVYRASPESYAPSPDYWTDKKLPTTIDATCRVLDIPLNIRYRLYDGKKDVVSVQAGLSSYIMLNEEYTYHYNYSANPYSKTREIANQNQHWFRVQNLSVGYSRKLTPAFSVGVEPFIKIPLSGIGEGNVKLTSTGVFFTAGYIIPLKR